MWPCEGSLHMAGMFLGFLGKLVEGAWDEFGSEAPWLFVSILCLAGGHCVFCVVQSCIAALVGFVDHWGPDRLEGASTPL